MKKVTTLMLWAMFFQAGISQTLIPYRSGDQWGYANEQGAIVIKPKYEAAGEFRANTTWVKKNGKYGFIDKKDRL